MQWPKGTTFLPAFAGTCATLSLMPKAVSKQVSSLTSSTTCWSFCTMEAMEAFLQDRKAMGMAAETRPPTRIRLFTAFHVKQEVFEVWELVDREPPSTAPELAPSVNHDRGRDGTSSEPPREKPVQCLLPALVMEVSDNGEIVTWPGPEVVA